MLLSANKHRIHFDFVGPQTGQVVCFAHAMLADSGMWSDQLSALVATGKRVLRVDMRGHGGSDSPSEECSVSDLASDIIAVLDHLELDRVHFVGLSIGGVIGQSIAIHHRHRLHTLVLSDTNPRSAPNVDEIWSSRLATVRAANSAAPLAAGMMARLLTDAFKQRHPVRWNQIFQTIVSTTPAGVYAAAQALRSFDFAAQLSLLDVPTLVLCGQNDPATPPSEAMKIVNLVPGAVYREIPDALHFPNVEKSELYNHHLLEWLQSSH